MSLGYASLQEDLISRFETSADRIDALFDVFTKSLHSDRVAATINGVDTSNVVDMIWGCV